ncbi:sterol desaturase family protein [Thiohalorhabdus sp. Cl-TMA]|uniref:Sterol desaturase family protein n=1 Tax=Thiohalorhabdus methylotrophus TaxID=3242694 RepID=A0ABV4TSD7_9GAMM
MSQGSWSWMVLAGVFAGLVAAEVLWPRRQGPLSRFVRWTSNGVLFLVNGHLQSLLGVLGAGSMALLAEQEGWGLFQLVQAPAWLAIPLCVAAADLLFYARHRLLHAFPLLWRIHQVHHDDSAMDASTGFRFHPLEAVLELLTSAGVVLLLGMPVVGVAVIQLLALVVNLFQHTNVRLPGRLDHCLRYLVVTPDMHRVHHSVVRAEADSNYGVVFPWWDYLFGSYRARPAAGHAAMTVGVRGREDPGDLALFGLLLAPFRRLG